MVEKNRVAAWYDHTSHAYGEAFFHELEKKSLDRLLLRRFCEENMGKGTVLDLACGPGQTTQFLAQQRVDPLIGIDLSPGMIAEAKSRNHSKARFEVGDMMNLRFGPNEIAAAICFYGIVHFRLEELEQALHEIYRVLQAGGQFLFSFHVGAEQHEVDEFLGMKVEEMTFYFFETDRVLDLLKRVGFTLVEVLERRPYEGVEYPSKRAYITVEKASE